MPTPTNDSYEDDSYEDDGCDDSEWVLPIALASGSAMLLGYVVGRVTYRRDVRDALRRIEESPEPITISIRTL